MNTIRSTERHLTLLALKRGAKATALKCRQPLTQSRELFTENRQVRRNHTKLGSRTIRLSKLKTYDIQQARPLSQAPEIQSLLINPRKPHPFDCKEVSTPISPLTLPRFPNRGSDIPSVTKILSATMPAAAQFLLDRWKESMIKKLGAAGFSQYQKETFERGHLLHALLASYLLNKREPVEGSGELSKEIVINLWRSIQNVVREKISNVRLVEHIVTHPEMKYRGIVDCVAFYEDELVVIDFKTAEKPKKNVESLYDNPLQVTAYCGAINNDMSIPSHVIDRNITSGLVIVAYVDGSEASTYYLNSEKVATDYWKQWTTRLDQFSKLEELRQKKDSVVEKRSK